MAAAAIDEGGEGTRRRILEAAYTLFYRHGFVRVALEAIAAEAGVTKRTLYYHFRSKDDLLAAALELHSGLALARIREWGAGLPADPQAMVEALFAELARWATGPNFEGAGYTRLVMELADLPGHPARAVAKRHKATVEALARGRARRARCRGARGGRAPHPAAARRRHVADADPRRRELCRDGGGDGEGSRAGSGIAESDHAGMRPMAHKPCDRHGEACQRHRDAGAGEIGEAQAAPAAAARSATMMLQSEPVSSRLPAKVERSASAGQRAVRQVGQKARGSG